MTNIKSNIRELEGALTKIVALSRLNKCDITLTATAGQANSGGGGGGGHGNYYYGGGTAVGGAGGSGIILLRLH